MVGASAFARDLQTADVPFSADAKRHQKEVDEMREVFDLFDKDR